MKKISSLILVLVIFCFCLVACSNDKEIKEYHGTKLIQLQYGTIDYNGGYKSTYIVDFENNTVKQGGYLPQDDIVPDLETIAEFTEEQEIVLINKLFSYGLFDIKEKYESPEGIIDGGGWHLEIKYEDGTKKLSTGSNNVPNDVFYDCAKAFYDICGDGIVGYVESDYYLPPKIDCALHYKIENNNYSFGNNYFNIVNYSWNGFTENTKNAYNVSDSIFEITKGYYEEFEYSVNSEYTFVLFTANYKMYGDYPRFKECIVKSYALDESLTDEKLVFKDGWFSQTEFKIENNRLYIITLNFKNSDFVEYSFNTKVN